MPKLLISVGLSACIAQAGLTALLALPLLATALPAVASAQAGQENQPQPGVYCPHLTRDLKFRDRDATTGGEVTELQKFLVDYYDLNPTTYITGYFGRLTQSNVIRFQREQNLPAYGYVGPLTRAAIARVCGTATPPPTQPPPKIDSIIPSSGPAGIAYPIQALLRGSFFTSTGNTIHFGPATVSNLASADGTTISFYVPKELDSHTEVPPMVFPFGDYDLYVSNANGTSNAVVFTLTGGPTPTNASCTWNNHTILHSQIIAAYQSSSVAYGQQCLSEQRTCNNGTLSGTYAYASCSVSAAASCTFNNQTVAHNATVTAYQSATVPAGQQCVSQTRTCSNGTLSGSYTNATCSVQSPLAAVIPTCIYKGQTYAEGQGITVPYVNQPGATLSLTCDNAVWVLGALNNIAAGANICDLGWGSSDLGCSPYTGTPAEYVSATPRHGRAGITVTVQTRASRDYATFCEQYSISWGDGRSDTNNPTGIPHCPYSDVGKTMTHTYAAPGSYAIGYSTSVHGQSALAYIRVD